MTVKELFDIFDLAYIDTRLKFNTQNGYRNNIRLHILPHIGDYDITAVNYTVADKLLLELKNKGLSNTSIKYVFSVLRKAFNFALGREYLQKNIFSSYDFPLQNRYQYTVLKDYEVDSLIDFAFAADSDIFPAVLLAARYGLRRGEALGVKTADFRQYDCILLVSRSANDVDGRRIITEPKYKSVRTVLLTKRDLQRLTKHSLLREASPEDYLCRDYDGNYITTNQLQNKFKQLLKACELPDVRFHDLRHSYATSMLAAGVHPKIVQSVLGHSDIQTTLDIYSHYDASLQAACLMHLISRDNEMDE